MKKQVVSVILLLLCLLAAGCEPKQQEKKEDKDSLALAQKEKQKEAEILDKDSCLYLIYDEQLPVNHKIVQQRFEKRESYFEKSKITGNYLYRFLYPICGGWQVEVVQTDSSFVKDFEELSAYKIYDINELWFKMQPLFVKDDSVKKYHRENKISVFPMVLPSHFVFYANKGIIIVELDSLQKKATFTPTKMAYKLE